MWDVFRNLKEETIRRAGNISARVGNVFRNWTRTVDGFLDEKWTRTVDIINRFRDRRNFTLTIGVHPLSQRRLTELRKRENNSISRINSVLRRARINWIIQRPAGHSIFVNDRTVRLNLVSENPVFVPMAVGIIAFITKNIGLVLTLLVTSVVVMHGINVAFRTAKKPTPAEIMSLVETLPEEERADIVEGVLNKIIPEARPGFLESIRNIVVWVVIAVIVILGAYVIYQHEGFKKRK